MLLANKRILLPCTLNGHNLPKSIFSDRKSLGSFCTIVGACEEEDLFWKHSRVYDYLVSTCYFYT